MCAWSWIDRSEAHVATAASLDPERIEGRVAEVGPGMAPLLRGCDVVLNTAGPFYLATTDVARAAIEVGAHYVDICDDVEGTRAILALDEAARGAGVAVLTGAGSSPGIANWMAARILSLRPECDGVRVVWVVRDADPGGLAPLRHMLHMAVHPAPAWRDGAVVDAPGYLPETALEHPFPAPLGPVRAFNTAHPEPLTLGRAYPHLRQVVVQGSLLPTWANDTFSVLGRMGFGDDELRIALDDGTELEPADALWRLLWARHRKRHGAARSDAMTAIQVQGLSGDRVLARLTAVDDESMMRTTGIGAAAAVLATLEEAPAAGANGVEALNAERALAIVEELFDSEGAVPAGLVLRSRPSASDPRAVLTHASGRPYAP